MISFNLFLVALIVSIREDQRVVQSLFRVKFLSSPAVVMQPSCWASFLRSADRLMILLKKLYSSDKISCLSVLFFGTRRVLIHCHWLRRYYFHSTYVLCLFSLQLLKSRYIPTVLVQLIQKILICKVLNSCTKRKLDEQGSRTTQFRVPSWKPDSLGAPGSYRVELIGVTPLK